MIIPEKSNCTNINVAPSIPISSMRPNAPPAKYARALKVVKKIASTF